MFQELLPVIFTLISLCGGKALCPWECGPYSTCNLFVTGSCVCNKGYVRSNDYNHCIPARNPRINKPRPSGSFSNATQMEHTSTTLPTENFSSLINVTTSLATTSESTTNATRLYTTTVSPSTTTPTVDFGMCKGTLLSCLLALLMLLLILLAAFIAAVYLTCKFIRSPKMSCCKRQPLN